MKRFLYSNYTKFVAALLIIALITATSVVFTNFFVNYEKEEHYIYKIDREFVETSYFQSYLHAPEALFFNVFYDLYNVLDEETRQEIQNGAAIINNDKVIENIKLGFENLYCKEKVEYFAEINGIIFTNCGATQKEDLMNKEFYYCVYRDNEGYSDRFSSHALPRIRPYLEDINGFDKTSEITIITAITDSYVAECKAAWDREALLVKNVVFSSFACLVTTLLLFIYLLCVCGKDKNGEHKSMWIDNLWLEVHLIFILAFGLAVAGVCVFAIKEKLFAQPIIAMSFAAITALASAVILNSLLSVVRNLKLKIFLENSIILRILLKLVELIFGIFGYIRNCFIKYRNTIFKALASKSGIMLEFLLLLYTAAIFACAVAIYSPLSLLAVPLFGWAVYFIACRSRDIGEIKKGVNEVRNGNLSYKIPQLKSTDINFLADNINDIAKGLDDSVSAKVRAERMKTELITNVSHDLKTPLTSIINYTRLLSEIDGLPEDAKDYIKVIATKSDQLKKLTQDLFDISKAQSGNEEISLEKIDVSLLINQSIGEHNGEIESSGISLSVETPKELYISADGKKMSRVMANLLNNAIKYSLKNTRVFISATEQGGEVIVEFKNIASYPMNFTAEEIVGRFVRGDESRTADGNGLGLAIAKSYTEICNGSFDIIIDGDMFKVILKFKKYV